MNSKNGVEQVEPVVYLLPQKCSKSPAITKVADAYYNPIKPIKEVIYLGIDLPCIRALMNVDIVEGLKVIESIEDNASSEESYQKVVKMEKAVTIELNNLNLDEWDQENEEEVEDIPSRPEEILDEEVLEKSD
ncbi:4480_t:CDS:2 [Gigaspora margarita]|uniref:4480_t:CDS:1 n=1 Tax=Gigaspora margarita TaxID=4874 RepID=A0ABN7UVG4_GIGMA|nr:4480_t:CDS:2 [Gigaspora margarita]